MLPSYVTYDFVIQYIYFYIDQRKDRPRHQAHYWQANKDRCTTT